MFLIDDNKDADSQDNTQHVAMINDEQIKYIYTMISTKDIDKVKVKEAYKVESMKDLTAEQAVKLIQQLKAK